MPEMEVAVNRAVFAFLLLSAAVPVSADIIHVPGQYPTIQQGIDAAVSGDIVLVAPGRYVEEIQLKAGVVVRGAGEGKSIIDGGGDAGDVVTAIGNSIRNDTKLSGFSILGAANGGGMPGGASVFCNSGAAPEIFNCRMESSDAGIDLWNGSNAFIHNNVICHNTYDGFSTGSGATFVNNTVHSNRIGVYDYSGYGPVVMNNIITNNRTYGVYGPSGGQGPVLSYNDAWGNAENYHQATPGVGSDSVDPLYVDTIAGDYHLGPGSPCIDCGNPAPEYNDPDGTRNDMGAYGGPGAVSNKPAITSLVPARNALGVATPPLVYAGFNVAMDPATLHDSTVRVFSQLTGWRRGPYGYDSLGQVIGIYPSDDFWPGELVTVDLSRGLRSAGGDTFPGCVWQFNLATDGGSGRFSDTVQSPVNSNPTAIAAADFGDDGELDLAVAEDGSGQVSVYLGGGGRFSHFGDYPTGAGTRAVCYADFDNGIDPDIAAANGTAGTISILKGRGGGDFDPAVNYPCSGFPSDIAAADVDLDGDMDLVVPLFEADSVAVLLNNGDGTFGAPTRFACGDGPTAVGVGDLDNDGRPDLVVTNGLANNFASLLNTGHGGFARHGSYSAGSGTSAIRLGDFNEDGTLDAAVTGTTENYVSAYTGDGAGGFSGRHDYTTGASARQVVAADLDADGHLDLAVANKDANTVSVLLGTGTGTFGNAVNWTPANDPLGLAYGDVDNDGDLDLVAASYTTSKLTALLNDDALIVEGAEPPQYATAATDTTDVGAGFSLALDPSTLDSTSFKVSGSLTGLHRGPITYDSVSHIAVLDPAANFATGEQVTGVFTKNIRSRTGVNLKGFGWTFAVAIGAASAGTFGTPTNYSAGSEVRGAWAADFDADGDFDLAITSNSPAAVAVLKNNGDGTFGTPAFVSVQSDPISLFGADFDSDGDFDLACFHNQPGSSRLEILKNNGAGVFTVSATYSPAVLGQSLSGGDFDADGDVDLVLADGWGSQDNVRIMTNDGTGAFSGPRNYSAGSWARGAVAIDAENDGDFDLAVANAGNNNVSVLYNDGNGIFSSQADFGAGASPNRVYANDFNADGRVDLAVANYGENNASILLNNASGGFLPAVSYPTGGTTQALAGGDFDGDRDIDIVLSSVSGNFLAVLANNGDGTFAAPVTYAVGTLPWDCVVADFNRDRALDLACANYTTNNVSVLFATGLGVSANPSIVPRSSFTVFPNPFRGSLLIALDHLATGPLDHSSLRIYDAAGRLVRSLPLRQPLTPGPYSLSWDGRDNAGRRVAPGLYFVTLESGAGRARAKVVLSR